METNKFELSEKYLALAKEFDEVSEKPFSKGQSAKMTSLASQMNKEYKRLLHLKKSQ